jgi:ABC-2 type transport system ATP-binding protein
MDETIEVRGLTKRYGATVAVDDLTFSVSPGRVTGFVGPNGAGKSTTMRLILGLAAPDAGMATVGGEPYGNKLFPLREVGPATTSCGWCRATISPDRASTRSSSSSDSLVSVADAPAASRSGWPSGSASPRRSSLIRRS